MNNTYQIELFFFYNFEIEIHAICVYECLFYNDSLSKDVYTVSCLALLLLESPLTRKNQREANDPVRNSLMRKPVVGTKTC